MSVTSAMYTGVSGLLSNSEAMNVIGNNISNVNTAGFKTGRSLFADMLSDNMGTFQVGTGTKLQAANDMFTQGAMQGTGNVTDLCISGNSFFALKGAATPAPVGTQDAAYLTRAGSFHVDGSLSLVNPEGYQVLDTEGNPVTFTDTFSASMQTFATDYGGAGVAALLSGDLTAVKALADADATKVSAAETACAAVTSAASAYAAAPSAGSVSTLATALSAAHDALVAANGTSGTPATLTSTAAVTTLAADGSAAAGSWKNSFGSISKISEDGLITYLGKDGITENYYSASGVPGVAATTANAGTVQRLALVTAVDPTALQKVGGSLYKAIPAAGVAHSGFSLAANTPNGASEKIISNSLESSNTDMAKEFVSMIITQRAYSASSRTITTTDQMTQEVLGLIR